MKQIRALTFGLVLALADVCSVSAMNLYVVKSNDTLSQIAHKEIGGRVWGKRGALERLLAVNPLLRETKKIRVGLRVRLPIVEDVFSRASRSPTSSRREPSAKRAKALDEADSESLTSEDPFSDSAVLGFFVLPSVYTSQITGSQLSNSTTAVFASELSQRIGLGLEQDWGEGIITRLRWDLMSELWRVPLGYTSIIGSRQTRNRFGADADFSLFRRLTIGLSLGQEQRIVYRGRPLGEMPGQIFEKLSTTEAALNLKFTPLLRKRSSWSVFGSAGVLLPAATNVFSFKLGQIATVATEFSQRVGTNWTLKARYQYNWSIQSSDVLRIKRTDNLIGISIGFELSN
jgi:hypothetical protein